MARSVAVLVVFVMVTAFAVPMVAVAASAAVRGPVLLGAPVLPDVSGTTSYSTNWAGYVATASAGQVKQVTATWVEPKVKCGSSVSVAVFWVGIDGAVTSAPTVEQAGTFAECVSGVASYYSWWEMYPANDIQIFAAISPGDHFSASVTYHSSSDTFTMKIKDTTSGVTYSKTSSQSGTTASTAECIAEDPGGDSATTSGLYPLADFGKVSFSSCKAKIGSSSGGIGTYSTVTEEVMLNTAGTHDLALPSALTGNSAFKVTWKASS